MGMDGKISKYLTDRHFSRLLRRMKSVGVKFVEANTVEGIIFFVPDTEQLKHRSLEGTLHAKLLDPRIARLVNDELKPYRFELRYELNSECSAAHATMCSRQDISELSEEDFARISEEYNYVRVKIELKGLVFISNWGDYLAGLKVNVRGLNRLRHNVWLEPMKHQHITCSFLGGLKFERYLKKRCQVLE